MEIFRLIYEQEDDSMNWIFTRTHTIMFWHNSLDFTECSYFFWHWNLSLREEKKNMKHSRVSFCSTSFFVTRNSQVTLNDWLRNQHVSLGKLFHFYLFICTNLMNNTTDDSMWGDAKQINTEQHQRKRSWTRESERGR